MITTTGKSVQQVLDELAVTLIKQGRRCLKNTGHLTNGEVCVYGDNNGNHCGIGWLLPCDRLDLMLYMGSLSTLLDENIDLGPNDSFIRKNKSLLSLIQSLHDLKSYIYRRITSEKISSNFGINMSSWTRWIELGE